MKLYKIIYAVTSEGNNREIFIKAYGPKDAVQVLLNILGVTEVKVKTNRENYVSLTNNQGFFVEYCGKCEASFSAFPVPIRCVFRNI